MSPEVTCPWRGRLPHFQPRTWIEPVVASSQVAASLYDAGLLLVVKASYAAGGSSNHSASPSPRGALEDQQQRAISNFYIIYNLVVGLSPLLSAYGLGWLSDRYHRKISICVSLLGFTLSRLGLLLKVLLDWPVEVLYGAAALNGLCGGFSAFWSGVMALGSLGSSEGRRSVRLILIDMILGLAGFCGSMASGHLFKQIAGHSGQGLILTACSVSCASFALLYSLLVLKVPESVAKPRQELPTVDTVSGTVGTYRTLDPDQLDKQCARGDPPSPGKAKTHKTTISLLFVGAIIYDLAVVGTVDVMPLFVLREPLSWNQVQVGYARAVMLFALIPITTIRSAMSKLIKGSSYGKAFVILQLSLALTGVVTSTLYNKIYQLTMDMFAGSCFAISSVLSFLAIIPISIVAYKEVPWSPYGDIREK
ncbi:solute carrier family 46 member 2 isoform X2 [Saimiri boliviensis]|uniref:solute carrier family 46 member 2 isoform X2 n=1 Tax=Saimiri boliviensis TaxID=27679 RepID=UPI000533E385|nr:thymic stromal cotransporter homolog isoform X2 [Saimiri boliviensis boliviensis]